MQKFKKPISLLLALCMLLGLCPVVAYAEEGTSSSVTEVKATLGDDANFDDETIKLSECLYTLGNKTNNDGEFEAVSATVNDSSVYLNIRSGSDAFTPNEITSATIKFNAIGDGNFTVQQTSGSGGTGSYLYFHYVEDSNGRYLHFDRNGSVAAPYTTFQLYRPATDSDTESSGIPGYIQIKNANELSEGTQILIVYTAAENGSTYYYVVHPSDTSGANNKYDHVARVAVASATSAVTITPTLENVECYYYYWTDYDMETDKSYEVVGPLTSGENKTLQWFNSSTYTGYLLFAAVPAEGCIFTSVRSSDAENRYPVSAVGSTSETYTTHNSWDSIDTITEAIKPKLGENAVVFGWSRTAGTLREVNAEFTLTAVKPKITVAVSANPSSNLKVGDTVTFTITVTPDQDTAEYLVANSVEISSATIGGQTVTGNLTSVSTGGDSYTWTYEYVVQASDLNENNLTMNVEASAVYKSEISLTGGTSVTSSTTATNTGLATCTLTSSTVTLSYDANGGKGTIPASETGTTSGVLKASFTVASGDDLSRTGYTFTGWNTKQDGSGDSYSAGETIEIDTDTTLYAQWTKKVVKENPELTVTKKLTYVNGEDYTGGTVEVGDVLTYTIRVKNTGDVDLRYVTVTDELWNETTDTSTETEFYYNLTWIIHGGMNTHLPTAVVTFKLLFVL